MDARAFFYLVAQMREAQKAYFATRDRLVFRSCRALENDVDREIERVRQIVNAQSDNQADQQGNDAGPTNTETIPG